MGRLIDADDLIEVIKESRPLNWTDSESEIQEDADYNQFIEMINEQPTAYDIEKVVDSVRVDCCTMGFDESQTEILVDDVRKGGVE